MADFAALPGFYNLMFLYLEPLSTLCAVFSVLLYPGTAWYWHELVPSSLPAPTTTAGMDSRTVMAMWQLTNCYFLLAMISPCLFRTVRDALPDNPVAQERILGALFGALAVADVTHIALTLFGLPADLRFDFANWNTMVHGNTTFVVVLFVSRMSWFTGIGRTRYYFGQPVVKMSKKSS